MSDILYNNPLHTPETRLEIAIGAIASRDTTIKNLREQIKNLREKLKDAGYFEKNIDLCQYKHLK